MGGAGGWVSVEGQRKNENVLRHNDLRKVNDGVGDMMRVGVGRRAVLVGGALESAAWSGAAAVKLWDGGTYRIRVLG